MSTCKRCGSHDATLIHKDQNTRKGNRSSQYLCNDCGFYYWHYDLKVEMTTEERVTNVEYDMYHACEAFVAAFQHYCDSVDCCTQCLLKPESASSKDCFMEEMKDWMVQYVDKIDYKRADYYRVRIGYTEGGSTIPQGKWKTTKSIPIQAICEIFNCTESDIKVLPYFD